LLARNSFQLCPPALSHKWTCLPPSPPAIMLQLNQQVRSSTLAGKIT
jgi:hypothetical protein